MTPLCGSSFASGQNIAANIAAFIRIKILSLPFLSITSSPGNMAAKRSPVISV